jgi:hypothetical protein
MRPQELEDAPADVCAREDGSVEESGPTGPVQLATR